MKRWGCVVAILICSILTGGLVRAGEPGLVEVFFVPEHGFIRVNARFPMPGDVEVVEFTLFPNAQITALWIPGLAAYEVDRTGTGTAVVVRMAPGKPNEHLEVNYEGFLPNYDLLTDKTLNRNLQWFPEFAGLPVGDYRVKITLPQEYVPRMRGDLVEESRSTFSTYTWILADQDYPVIWFGDHVPDFAALEPEPEPAELELPTAPPGVDEEPAEPQIEQIEIPPDLADAFECFAKAYAGRDLDGLESLLDRDFPDQSEFLAYLDGRPETDSPITGRIMDAVVENTSVLVYAEFCDGETLLSKARMRWHKPAETWLVQSFTQIPAGYQFAEKLDDPVLQQRVGDLAGALANLDLAWLDRHLTGAKNAAISFLRQVNDQMQWAACAVDPEHHQIVFLVQTASGLSLRLLFTYIPHGQVWSIKSFAAIPSSDK